jgi:hypothetical protein
MMNQVTILIALAILMLTSAGLVSPAAAQQDWTAAPAGCASTDNNFYSGTPSADFPVVRYITPGARVAFNGLHTGYIAFICNVTNPQDLGINPAWNQLEITYVDPDGLQTSPPDVIGADAQIYVALGRIEKTSGVYSDVAVFDSNLECPSAQPALECIGNNATVWRMGKPLSHTFDFEHYAYTVYGRVYRTFGYLKPILIQLRLNAQ